MDEFNHYLSGLELNNFINDIDKVKFVCEHSEKYLRDLLSANEKIQNRSLTLLGFTLTIASGLVLYLLKESNCIVTIIFIYTCCIAFILFFNVKTSLSPCLGNQPCNLINQSTIKDEVNLAHIMLSEIKKLNRLILESIDLNKKLSDKINLATFMFLLIPLFTSFLIWATRFFNMCLISG